MSNTRGFRFRSVAGLSLSAVLATLISPSGPASAQVGDQPKTGDKLIDLGASPAAVVTYKQALTTLSLKQHALERKQELFKQMLATREDVEKAEADLAEAEATMKEIERLLRGE